MNKKKIKILHETDSFDGELILSVWLKGDIIPGYDPDRFRMDADGYVMEYYNYGMRIKYGWEIDHIVAPDMGGASELNNLRPLQWENKLRKDNYMKYTNVIFHDNNK